MSWALCCVLWTLELRSPLGLSLKTDVISRRCGYLSLRKNMRKVRNSDHIRKWQQNRKQVFLLFIGCFWEHKGRDSLCPLGLRLKDTIGNRPNKSETWVQRKASFTDEMLLTFCLISLLPWPTSRVFSSKGENFTRGSDSKDLMKHNSENKFAREGFCWEKPKRNMLFTHKKQPEKFYRATRNIKIWRKWWKDSIWAKEEWNLTKTREGRDSQAVMMRNRVLYVYVPTIQNYRALMTHICTSLPE